MVIIKNIKLHTGVRYNNKILRKKINCYTTKKLNDPNRNNK